MTRTNREVVDWMHKLVHEGTEMKLDSREVRPGDIFCAIPGTKSDGRAFIRVAAARGAAGVIYEADGTPRGEHYPVASLAVSHLASRLGEIAALFYGDASQKMTGVAVTGTNGKTTSTFWLGQLLTKLGAPAAVIGTVGIFFNGRQIPAPHLTTPDAVTLESLYARLARDGAKAFAVEASSVGLEQGRLSGSHFRVDLHEPLARPSRLPPHHGSLCGCEGNPFPLARTRRGGGECRRSFKRALCGDGSGARHSRLDDGARGKGRSAPQSGFGRARARCL